LIVFPFHFLLFRQEASRRPIGENSTFDKLGVRTVSDMVVDEPVEPIFVILQIKQTTSGGIRQSHSDAFVSFYLKCISLLGHNEQSKLPVQ
jgi:hypothetical protein